ncbi:MULTISPECIES: hypothetical protein [unclassified Streptomyces]|uniref:hypothetical protein n=1 Tax=unclassified Streptomyces TaxID=2593676 RepID=UPI002024AA74|nr:hypothetical protein [Streptomyces sp. A 4/2]
MIQQVAEMQPRRIPYAFRYEIPEEFTCLPDPTASDGWDEVMRELLPAADDEQRNAASQQLRGQLPQLSGEAEQSVILTAMCLGIEEVGDEGRLSMGLLAVSVRSSDHSDQLMTAEGIYRAKEQKFFGEGGAPLQEVDYELGKGTQGPQDMLLAAKLPSGPGVMSTSLRSLKLPTSDETLPGMVLPVASLQLVIPAPRNYIVYVTIATPSVFLLDSYGERLAHIGRTLSFDSPEAE